MEPHFREEESTNDFSKKRKKKKSFAQKMKKFGKQGRFGKGQEIEASTYNYFVQVLENLNQKSVYYQKLFYLKIFAEKQFLNIV